MEMYYTVDPVNLLYFHCSMCACITEIFTPFYFHCLCSLKVFIMKSIFTDPYPQHT